MTLLLDLPPGLEAKLAAEADKLGIALPDYALEVLQRSTLTASGGETNLEETHPLLQLTAEIQATMPPDAWEDMPHDRARNYKHTLYGYPKDRE